MGRDDVRVRDADVSLPGSRWDRLAKMADPLSSGLGEEQEKEKEDRERDKKAAKTENINEKDGVTETLAFNDKNGGSKGKKRNLSGESLPRYYSPQFDSANGASCWSDCFSI